MSDWTRYPSATNAHALRPRRSGKSGVESRERGAAFFALAKSKA